MLLSVSLFAQQGPEVVVSVGPPQTNWSSLYYRDGSNNIEYVCIARSIQPSPFAWYAAGSSVTLTSVVDSSNTATVTTTANHGLLPGNIVQIQGVTTDTDLNGVYTIATVGSATTFTITTANVTDGAYTGVTDPAMNLSTQSPRTNAAVWSIMKLYWTTTYLDRRAWAQGATNAGYACDSRTTYSYQ